MIKNFLSSKYSLILFILLAFLYNIIVYKSLLTTIIMFFILLYFYNLYDIQTKLKNDNFLNKTEIINKHYKNIIEENINNNGIENNNNKYKLQKYIDNIDIYPLTQKNEKLLFITHDLICKEIIYQLRFIGKYDNGDYVKLILLIENFLKTYYNIIIDRYDKDYVDVVLDLRKEILNILYNFKVDCPILSKKKINLHNIIDKEIIKFQSYSYKKLKNLNKKYPELNIKNPHGIHENDMYDNFKIIV